MEAAQHAVGDRDGLQCGEDMFPGNHAQRTIEILQLPYFLDSLVFWLKVEILTVSKVKAIPRQAEVAQGVPGRLRLRIFLTFGTTRVVVRQPNAPAAFTQEKSLVLTSRG